VNVLTRHRAIVATAMYVLIACTAGAAEMNGPMSSTKKLEEAAATPATDTAPPADSSATFDVEKLFANTCGWCHGDGGRVAGKGPKLMGTTLTDEEIVRRIMLGKPGAMPAFAGAFSGDQIKSIIKYIRELKPEGTPK
jgi:mono/diheme cytochrome c family protein